MTGSLAYRTHTAEILAGRPPAKYTRLLPFITGSRVVELGSAEGVLACLLAKEGKRVTAIEANGERHENAKALAKHWGVKGVTFVRGKAQDNLSRFANKDVFVAVRAIYYLRDDLDAVFEAVAKHVPTVVLCGNKSRTTAWRAGRPHAPLGELNRYAAPEGMREVLERHGYRVTDEVTQGDAIVVGQRVLG